jgi:hypothetical protein
MCVLKTSGKNGDNYSVIVTNSCGSVTSNPALLTISTAPVVSCPAPITTCAGSTVTFKGSATGTSPISYQWVNALAPTIVLSTTTSLTRTLVQSNHTYTFTATNLCGSSSCTACLTVNTIPTLTCQPSPITVCTSTSGGGVRCGQGGPSACFNICANGTNLTYKWLENGKVITNCINSYTGATTDNMCALNLTSAKNGYKYSVIVTNSCGSVTSNAAVLTVSGLPTITTQPVNVCVTNGGNATFSVTATNATTYQWQTGGSNIAGATKSSYTITGVTTSMSGKQYNVFVCNYCGCVNSSLATLTVTTPCPAPTCLSNSAGCSNSETLKWCSVTGAKTYTVKYWTKICGCGTDTMTISVNCASASICNLKCGHTYYWKVQTVCTNCNCGGGSSIWSTISSFTTKSCSCGRDMAKSDNSDAEIRVYPNPTTSIINVSMTDLISSPDMVIYNMSGQVVYTESKINIDNAVTKQVDMTNYAPGVYFIKLTNNEMVKTIKFIKQ